MSDDAIDVPARLRQLGIVLPRPPAPVAAYVPFTIGGGLLFVSGQGPVEADGTMHTGLVGAEVTLEAGQADARLVAINLIAQIGAACGGDFDRVGQVLKLFGMVRAIPDFGRHPEVIDGASRLFVDVFGARGRHARSAVGLGSLPRGITVEIECICALRS